MEHETPLSDLHFALFHSFQKLMAAIQAPKRDVGDQIPPRAVESEFDKYMLWAGNVGIMHTGDRYMLSLDYRLRESRFYRDRVTSFMCSLQNHLSKAREIILNETVPLEERQGLASDALGDVNEPDDGDESSEDSPWSEESISDMHNGRRNETDYPVIAGKIYSEDEELSRALEMTKFLITCLYKMPIRHPAALERLKNKLSGTSSFFQHFDAIKLISHYLQTSLYMLFPMMDPLVATRLGRMISLRRHLLAYRDLHSQNLQVPALYEGTSFESPSTQIDSIRVPEQDHPIAVAGGSQAALPVRSHTVLGLSRATTYHQVPDPLGETEDFVYPPSIGLSETSRASSYAAEHLQISIPPMPTGTNGRSLTQFLCPYCSITQNIRSSRAWRKHVLDDLKPYVCTFPGCCLQDSFFPNRDEWFQHEAAEHRMMWHCNEEGHVQYLDRDDFTNHMTQEHSVTFQAEQLKDISSMFKRSNRSSEGTCSLCLRYSSKLRGHISRHLQRIALFALPRPNHNANAKSITAQESPGHTNDNKSTSSTSDSMGLETHATEAGSVNIESEFAEDFIEEPIVPDSDDPEWHLITTKFAKANEVEQTTTFWEKQKLVLNPNLSEEERMGTRETLESLGNDTIYTQSHRRQSVDHVHPQAFEVTLAQLWNRTFESTSNEYDRRMVYLSGPTGWGKSTLIELLSNEQVLRDWMTPSYHLDKTVFVATYVFNDGVDTMEDTLDSFIESILHQTLARFPALMHMENFESESGNRLTYNNLTQTLSTIFEYLTDSICWILLDSLDTYQGNFWALNGFLSDLRSLHPDLYVVATGASEEPPLNITNHLALTSQAQAMRLFVENAAEVRTELQEPLVAEQLVEWATGLFLPLRVAVDTIRNSQDITNIMALPRPRPPQGLNGLYRYIYESLHKKTQVQAAKMVQFMMALPHPPRFLSLAAQILRDPKITPWLTQKDIITMSSDVARCHEATAHLQQVFPLVKVVSNVKPGCQNEVCFVHPTVRGFFGSTEGQKLLEGSAGTQNLVLYHCECLLAEAKVQWNISILKELGSMMQRLNARGSTVEEEEGLLMELRDIMSTQEAFKTIRRPVEAWKGFLVQYELTTFIKAGKMDAKPRDLLPHALGVINTLWDGMLSPCLVRILLELGADANMVETSGKEIWSTFLTNAWHERNKYDEGNRQPTLSVVKSMVKYGARVTGDIRFKGPFAEAKSIKSILRALFDDREFAEIMAEVRDDARVTRSQPRGSYGGLGSDHYVWFCDECGDGPNGDWHGSCSACFHQRCRSCMMEESGK